MGLRQKIKIIIIICMERIIQDIKNNNFKHLYLLCGVEDYLRKFYKNKLKSAIIGDDTMNYSYYEGKDISVPAIIDQAETMPFFADKRLIIIENSGLLKSGGEQLADYLKNIPEYVYFIISDSEVDKRSGLFKTCKNEGSVIEFEPYSGRDMIIWIKGYLKKYGKTMSDRDIEYLLTLTGEDMTNLSGELQKLVNYVGDREVVTKEDASEIVSRQIGDSIFKMVKAMGERRQSEALKYYYDLLANREPAFRILSLITRQYNILLQTKELLAIRTSDRDIATKVKVPPYFVKEYISQAGRYDIEQLKKALNACANADEDIKTGKMGDRLSVELLIIEFSK